MRTQVTSYSLLYDCTIFFSLENPKLKTAIDFITLSNEFQNFLTEFFEAC